MLRSRLPLIAFGTCLLGASATWADDSGYIDCTNHPDDTQVAAKAAKTQEVVGSLPCGERFTILQSGFFFTRIQTKDGKVGYVYTNLISHDYSATAAPQAAMAPAKMAARSSNPISAIAAAFKPKASAPAQMRVPAPPPAASPAPAPKPNLNSTPAPASTSPAVPPVQSTPPPQTQSVSTQSASSQDAAPSSLFPAKSGVIVLNETSAAPQTQAKPLKESAAKAPAPTVTESFPAKSAVVVQSETPPPAQPQSKPVQLAAAKPAVSTESFPAKSGVVVQAEPSTSVSMSPPSASTSEPSTIAANPEPSAPPQPEPSPAEPTASEFRAERPRAALEKPSGGHRRLPLIELFGGYSFARLNSGAGVMTNYNGGMGAFGLNLTPWLQVVADSSYNMIQSGGTKVVLYGNHYGPRLYWHRRNRWSAKPFVEGLFGGTRIDTTVTGTGGYTASIRAFSFKVGGGLDIRPSRHFEIRLLDADYYRTSFAGGTTPYQNNYWISTGVVIRLFGGGAE